MRSALTVALFALFTAGLSSGIAFFYETVLTQEQERSHARASKEQLRLAEVALTRRDEELRKLLNQTCVRDLNLERLVIELSEWSAELSGAKRFAEGLSRVLGSEVVLLTTRDSSVEIRARTLPANLELPRALLNESTKRSVPMVRGDRQISFVDACKKPLGRGELWVVSVRDADAVLAALGRDLGLDLKVASHHDPQFVVGRSLENEAGRNVGSLAVRMARAPRPTDWLLIALLGVSGGLVGTVLGFVVRAREKAHERALNELERAFDRVASGDLVSSIGLRTGERADQTFGTFDRMTKELREMRERLAQAEREAAFRDVAQRIAHEIKNPLFPIRTAMETLRKANERKLADFPEILDESTRAVLEEVTRMERIVREFAEFARLPKPDPGALDLVSLISDTLSIYTPEDVSVEPRLDASIGEVRADRGQITQALVNLLKNALDAAREHEAPKVRVELVKEHRFVAIHVDDNGPGIASDARERVLEPYFTTKAHGTGLGLAIVKRILSDHGGELVIGESSLGGARLTMRLPLAAERHSPSRP